MRVSRSVCAPRSWPLISGAQLAVGDTNEVFLLDVLANGQYSFFHSFRASADAAFSTDWSQTSQQFALGSQDGFVHVYDVRSLPASSSTSSDEARTPRKLAEIRTTQQGGPSGAVRKVKFSPGGRADGELLAFTEVSSVGVGDDSSSSSVADLARVAHSTAQWSMSLMHAPSSRARCSTSVS